MPATYEQKRAIMAQQYPEIAAALDQISASAANYDASRRKPKAKSSPQEWMQEWNARSRRNQQAAEGEILGLANTRRQAIRQRNSPGVTIGAPYQERSRPAERTDADAASAWGRVDAANAAGLGRHQNRSKLSPAELQANAMAFAQAKAAEKQAGGSFQQQARRFKRMAGLGYRDGLIAGSDLSPQDRWKMEMLRAQFDANQNQQWFENQMAQGQFGLQERQFDRQGNQQQFENQMAQDRFGLSKEELAAQREMARQQMEYQQRMGDRTLGLSERQLSGEEAQQEFRRQQAQREFEAQQASTQFGQSMQADQFELQRKLAEHALQNNMSEREKAMLGILAQTNPQAAAQFLQGGAQQNIGDAFNAISPQEREQLAQEFAPNPGWSFLPVTLQKLLSENRKKRHGLEQKLKRRGLSPEQISEEYNRIIGG